MQSSDIGKDFGNGEHLDEVPKAHWTSLPRSPLCFRSLINSTRSTGDHDYSISPLESSLDELGLTNLRVAQSTCETDLFTPIVDDFNDIDQNDHLSPAERSATISPEPWKAAPHVSACNLSHAPPRSLNNFNRKYDLSVLSRDIAPPPPSPSELLGFKPSDEKLQELTNRTGYSIEKRNGQRIYGGPPPNWFGPPPCRGFEIFVGKVPRDCYEDELVPIFEKVGKIYELRLMMDFSGSNRGYFFVRYTIKEDAQRAVKELNNYEIRPRWYLGVSLSFDNCRLWVSGYPRDRTLQEIQHELERMTEGVKEVELHPSRSSSTLDYLFIVYQTHRDAALARRRLVPGKVFLFDTEMRRVEWAEPEVEVDEEAMSKVKSLFVHDVPHLTEDGLFKIFSGLSNFMVDSVKKTETGNAFVNFYSRDSAANALKAVRKKGFDLNVQWAKPLIKQYRTKKQLGQVWVRNPQPCVRPQQGPFSKAAHSIGGAKMMQNQQRQGSHEVGSRYRVSPRHDNSFFDPMTGRQFYCDLSMPPPAPHFNDVAGFFRNDFSHVPKAFMSSADNNEYSENAVQMATLLASLNTENSFCKNI